MMTVLNYEVVENGVTKVVTTLEEAKSYGEYKPLFISKRDEMASFGQGVRGLSKSAYLYGDFVRTRDSVRSRFGN